MAHKFIIEVTLKHEETAEDATGAPAEPKDPKNPPKGAAVVLDPQMIAKLLPQIMGVMGKVQPVDPTKPSMVK